MKTTYLFATLVAAALPLGALTAEDSNKPEATPQKQEQNSDMMGMKGMMVKELVALYPIGSAVCEIADSDVGGWKAQTVTIYVREGDTWKASMTYVNNERVMH